jgi:hypothetical protein
VFEHLSTVPVPGIGIVVTCRYVYFAILFGAGGAEWTVRNLLTWRTERGYHLNTFAGIRERRRVPHPCGVRVGLGVRDGERAAALLRSLSSALCYD